jgi:hypothetical protein
VSKAEFIEKARAIYGDEYDYTMVPDKLENYSMIPIKCYKHGLFYESVYNFLNGKACFECSNNELN